jgi:hypothetical protein
MSRTDAIDRIVTQVQDLVRDRFTVDVGGWRHLHWLAGPCPATVAEFLTATGGTVQHTAAGTVRVLIPGAAEKITLTRRIDPVTAVLAILRAEYRDPVNAAGRDPAADPAAGLDLPATGLRPAGPAEQHAVARVLALARRRAHPLTEPWREAGRTAADLREDPVVSAAWN